MKKRFGLGLFSMALDKDEWSGFECWFEFICVRIASSYGRSLFGFWVSPPWQSPGTGLKFGWEGYVDLLFYRFEFGDEFIDHGVNGYLHAPDDVPGMVRSAVTLLADREHHQHMCEEARRDAVESFGTRCVMQHYVELYDRVLDGPVPRPAVG